MDLTVNLFSNALTANGIRFRHCRIWKSCLKELHL